MGNACITPFIPESAPFDEDQRAWLNGYFAGLFSRQEVDPAAVPAVAGTPTPAGPPVTILYGTQTGTAEVLAKATASHVREAGMTAMIHDLEEVSAADLKDWQQILIITSTYGDGEMPDNAQSFWEELSSDDAPALAGLSYSVLGLGDTNYPDFCQAARDFDRRLEELGASRIFPRADCDVDYDEAFETWLKGMLEAVGRGESDSEENTVIDRSSGDGAATGIPELPAGDAGSTAYNRRNPYAARLLKNRRLNAGGSKKDTRHIEVALEDSSISYEAGDAMGVVPQNCPMVVDDLLDVLGFSGREEVADRAGDAISLRDAYLGHYEITTVPRGLIQFLAEKTGDAELNRLTHSAETKELEEYLWGREIIDLVQAFPGLQWTPADFVGRLRPLQPRLYSISSSPKVHPDQVHTTVGVVRYTSFGRNRKGVCSTYLAERAADEKPVPVFIQKNRNFRPPADDQAPAIMVGPGTGIAPFRAFLQERQATGARGRNWLFFGDHHASTDFLYREELETMHSDGVLSRLDTAFSRDNAQKVYVQHRMKEHAGELYGWLEEGAHFYVCGDAKRMAPDVDRTLHEVIETAAGVDSDTASAYVRRMKKEKRYLRDVY